MSHTWRMHAERTRTCQQECSSIKHGKEKRAVWVTRQQYPSASTIACICVFHTEVFTWTKAAAVFRPYTKSTPCTWKWKSMMSCLILSAGHRTTGDGAVIQRTCCTFIRCSSDDNNTFFFKNNKEAVCENLLRRPYSCEHLNARNITIQPRDEANRKRSKFCI